MVDRNIVALTLGLGAASLVAPAHGEPELRTERVVEGDAEICPRTVTRTTNLDTGFLTRYSLVDGPGLGWGCKSVTSTFFLDGAEQERVTTVPYIATNGNWVLPVYKVTWGPDGEVTSQSCTDFDITGATITTLDDDVCSSRLGDVRQTVQRRGAEILRWGD